MCRTAVDAAGRPGTSRETFRRETKFALGVLAVSHERIRLLPGYSPEIPLPAPALRLPAARSPGTGPPAGPGPGELLAALETAEDGHGPGSREALAALSRLGEAVADEEALTDRPWPGWGAWKARAAGKAGEPGKAGGAKEAGEAGAADDSGKADVPAEAGESGKAGGPKEAGEASAEALLRSASAGLDALLGRTHPYSLDARERLARFLAGGSGPVLPLDPLPSELPAEGALREAMDMFLETAWERASKIPGARAATGGAEPGTPELLERLPAVLRLSRDRAAFAAAASAAECDMLTGDFPQGRSECLAEAGRAADDVLGDGAPASVRFRAHHAGILASRDMVPEAREVLCRAVPDTEGTFGASARETARAAARAGRYLIDTLDPLSSLPRYCEALETLELPDPDALPFRRGAAPGPGLPPGREGRDRLAMRVGAARCFMFANDAGPALAALAPFLDELPRLPPGHDGPGAWPWPAELAGHALCIAGEATLALGDFGNAESLLRRAVATAGPHPSDPIPAGAAFSNLADIVARRGGTDSLREAAALEERGAEHWARYGGPACSAFAAESLESAAKRLDAAGDASRAAELLRKAGGLRALAREGSPGKAGPASPGGGSPGREGGGRRDGVR
jgi:hypothetical protein